MSNNLTGSLLPVALKVVNVIYKVPSKVAYELKVYRLCMWHNLTVDYIKNQSPLITWPTVRFFCAQLRSSNKLFIFISY